MNVLLNKLHNQRGINRLVLILLVLVLVMAVVVAIPIYRSYKEQADELACTVALRKAQEMLDVEYLGNYVALTYEEAVAIVERSKWEQEALCPAGGDYYIIETPNRNQVYTVTCGLHEHDTKLRTRLNASRVFELLADSLEGTRALKQDPPEEGFTYTLNSRKLTVIPLEADNGLRWGTSASIDHKGIVSFFSLSEEGELDWFVYADENHAAVWRASEGWSGDAYQT